MKVNKQPNKTTNNRTYSQQQIKTNKKSLYNTEFDTKRKKRKEAKINRGREELLRGLQP